MADDEVTRIASRSMVPLDPFGASGTFHPESGGGFTGMTIAERFRVEALLGRGASGVVYRALDLHLGERVALKLVDVRAARDPAEVERFKREIVIARRITHPNVIRIHDFGLIDDLPFISMELLEGGTLSDRIGLDPLPLDEACRIGAGIADALQAAHEAGIIHRDVKPDNVLFDRANRPKLVDFGIARSLDARATTTSIGTPYYMSPEQCEGLEVTERSDVYSLGVTLFELFTGRRPFKAESIMKLIALHCSAPAPLPRSIRADLPEQVERVILSCLEKDPRRRPARAGDVAKSLLAARAPSDHTAVVARPPRGWARGGWWLAGALLAMIGLGLATSSLFRAPDGAPATKTLATQATALASAIPTTAIAARTAAPTPAIAAATAKPTQVVAAAAPGSLTLTVVPGVEQIWIDGKIIREMPPEGIPLRRFPLAAGDHALRLVNRSLSYDRVRSVRIASDRHLFVKVDLSSDRWSSETR